MCVFVCVFAYGGGGGVKAVKLWCPLKGVPAAISVQRP